MRAKQLLGMSLAAGCLALSAVPRAKATEYTFSTYGLGSAAFGAGVTPPPGTYVSAASSFYRGDISGAINIGGLVFQAGAKAELFGGAVSGLYVPERKVLDGHLGLAVTVPAGHVGLEAAAQITGPVVDLSATRETSGSGFGDVVTRLQLGWEHGDFSHLVWVQAVAPTGKYDVGFFPIVGLHRPGIDTGWAFTWADKQTKLQVNGAVGFNFNFENDRTDFLSGNEVHFEWAVGYELTNGLVIGVVGYDWRQITGDSGTGALLGAFEGRVDAIGPGLSYTTLIDKMPLVLNLRHYEEYNADRRISGSMSIATVTLKF
jgi:hypothetical protein